jgi:hypothetical protein
MTQQGVFTAKTFSANALKLDVRMLGVVVSSKIMGAGECHGTLLTEKTTRGRWDHGYLLVGRHRNEKKRGTASVTNSHCGVRVENRTKE